MLLAPTFGDLNRPLLSSAKSADPTAFLRAWIVAYDVGIKVVP